MNNQTRNHLNLQKHIADQDHIIRVRNAEIAALRKRAEKAEQERDEARVRGGEYLIRAEKAEDMRDRWKATANSADDVIRAVLRELGAGPDTEPVMKAKAVREARDAWREVAKRKGPENPRPLTPDDITDEMVERALAVERREYDGYTTEPETMRELLTAALTEPSRPEGAEKVEAVLHQYWSGDINGDDLADRIVEEMNR